MNLDSLTDVTTNVAGMLILVLLGMRIISMGLGQRIVEEGTELAKQSLDVTPRPSPPKPAITKAPTPAKKPAPAPVNKPAPTPRVTPPPPPPAPAEPPSVEVPINFPYLRPLPGKMDPRMFIFRNGRALELTDAFVQKLKSATQAIPSHASISERVRIIEGVQDPDFRIECIKIGDFAIIGIRILHRDVNRGETIDQILEPGARFRTAVEDAARRGQVVEMIAWPDGFDILRKAKNFIAGKRIRYNWAPLDKDDTLDIGGGGKGPEVGF